MVTRTMPIAQAREKLTRLPEELEQEPETGVVAVTRRGKPVLAIMSWELCESIVETLEIMGDEDLMGAVRKGIREVAETEVVPWEQAQKALAP